MVDALVTIAAEGLLKKMLSVATNEIVLDWGYREKLTTICMMIEKIRGKLRDAERQKAKQTVMLWLKELKDVVDEADDVLDNVYYEMLRREVKERDRKPRKVHCFPSLKSISFRIEMGYKFENISKKLNEISKKAIYLGLQSGEIGLIPDSLQENTDSFLKESDIVGRGNDVLRIIELLTRSRKEGKLTIVPIVGKGGIGKTTLAKSVYNSRQIREEFDIRIWLCVSVMVDVDTLLAMIYMYLTRNERMVQTREVLIRNLQKELERKRYLLVLDNVWDEKQEHWDDFRSCMSKVNSHNGNGILVTTRNLFQDMQMDGYGYNTHFKMHDLVHDLSLSLSRNESLCLEGSTRDYVHSSQVKHLAVYQPANPDELINIQFGQRISALFKEDRTTRALHTLFFEGRVEKNISFQRFKCLRVLTISWIVCQHEIHDSIGELVHLRYLDFSHTKINFLPESIGNLYNLQTLNLSFCFFLWEFPKSMKNLISLRHFMCDGVKLIHHNVGQLTSLPTLSTFVVGREKGYQIGELGRLKHLRGNLGIYNLQEVDSKENAVKADLFGKTNLSKIVFHWSTNGNGNRNDKDVLKGLQPHANMKSLEIVNFSGDNFPLWVRKMANNIKGKWTPMEKLVKITLYRCHNCLNLPTLRNLPLLRTLVLKYMENLTCLSSSSCPGDDVTESTKPLSQSLRSLELVGMKSLEKWTDAAMNSSTMLSPILEKLYIYDCPKITLLDESQCHPLVSLTICFCNNLESIRSLEGLTSLEYLGISSCHNLLRIPDLHKHGRSLKSLWINDCNKMTCLPGGLDCLNFLQYLSLGSFSKDLHSFPRLQGIEKLRNNLRTLCLIGCSHWESIPEQVSHLTAMTSLTLKNLGIKETPIWLTNMPSIRHMWFYHCESLSYESVSHKAPREADSIRFNGKFLRRQRLNWVY